MDEAEVAGGSRRGGRGARGVGPAHARVHVRRIPRKEERRAAARIRCHEDADVAWPVAEEVQVRRRDEHAVLVQAERERGTVREAGLAPVVLGDARPQGREGGLVDRLDPSVGSRIAVQVGVRARPDQGEAARFREVAPEGRVLQVRDRLMVKDLHRIGVRRRRQRDVDTLAPPGDEVARVVTQGPVRHCRERPPERCLIDAEPLRPPLVEVVDGVSLHPAMIIGVASVSSRNRVFAARHIARAPFGNAENSQAGLGIRHYRRSDRTTRTVAGWAIGRIASGVAPEKKNEIRRRGHCDERHEYLACVEETSEHGLGPVVHWKGS